MKSFKDLHLGEEAIGGLSAGIIGTVIGFPLDVAKTRMQTAGAVATTATAGVGSGATATATATTTATSASVGRHLRPVGIVSLISGVVRKEGITGLYKGIGPPLISLSILNVTTFTQYAYYRELYNANHGWDVRNFAAGATCAPVSGVVSTVENLVKTQMMLDNVKAKQQHRPPEYSSSWNCFTSLIRRYGISIVYTGHGINTIREVSFLGPYFFFYEGFRKTFVSEIQRQYDNNHEHKEFGVKIAVPIAGGLSGALSWGLSFPLDLVRSRVQGQVLPPTHSAWQLARQLVQEKGFWALYAGSSASIARAFLVSGSRFSAYEGAVWLLRHNRSE